jgi:formamidopyrimidine-DNA glycosylase
MEEEFYTKGRRLNVKIICKRCGTKAEKETDSELKKEYSYYCPECDENLFSFECEEIKE